MQEQFAIPKVFSLTAKDVTCHAMLRHCGNKRDHCSAMSLSCLSSQASDATCDHDHYGVTSSFLMCE
jgi:hypothetical protein